MHLQLWLDPHGMRIVSMDTIEDEQGAQESVLAALAARVRQARGDMLQRTLAEAVGVHANTIGKLERGLVPPDSNLLLAIGRATGHSAAWLLLGDPYPRTPFAPPQAEEGPGQAVARGHLYEAPAALTVPRSLQAVDTGGYVYVPHFDVHASAGPGFFNDVEHVLAMRPFDAQYIRGKLGIKHNELALLNLVGRSYEPYLHSGDVTMVDRRDRESLEGPHAIRLDGALLVKQLQRMPGKVLRVSSKNAEFQPFDIVPSEDEERDFEVIGRLRWAGITMN